jgi:hypothetical protein
MAENQGQTRFASSGASSTTAEKNRDVASGITGAVRDAAAGVANTAKDWAGTAQNIGSGVAHGAEQAYTATRDAVVGGEQSVESFIRRHPIPVVLGALVVGCMFGCAMSRKY